MITKKIIFIILGIVATLSTLFIFVGRGKIEEKKIQDSYNFTKVTKADITQTVNIDGTVVSKQDIDLRFQASGVVENINYNVSDQVKKGDILANINANDQNIAVKQRMASLAQARANLNLKLSGLSNEDIAVYESKVESAKKIVETTKLSTAKDIENAKARINTAQVALTDARTNLDTVTTQNKVDLSIVYEESQGAIDSALVTIDKTLDTVSDILDDQDLDEVFSIQNIQYKAESNTKYVQTKDYFDTVLADKNVVDNNDYDAIDSLLDKTRTNLNMSSDLLDSVFNALASTITSSNVSQATLDAYKSSVNSLRVENNNAISTIDSKKQKILSTKTSNDAKISTAKSLINTAEATLNLEKSNLNYIISKSNAENTKAKNELALAENELNQKLSKPRDVDIAYLRAKVSEAEASLDLAKENLNKTNLISPVDGVIVDIKNDVGEFVNTTDVFIKLTAYKKKIEAYIPEIEVGKVQVGDKADIVLDAFVDRVFQGEVVSIDPVETNVQGVVYYKADIAFSDEADNDIALPGMTADITIKTAAKENVLTLPSDSVKKDGDRFYVQVLENNSVQTKYIQVGLIGDKNIEIISGLKEDEEVISFF